MSTDNEITFLATIPPVMSSLRFGGDVGRVMFEIPKSEVAKAVGLIALQDVVLEIRITRFADKRKREKKEPEPTKDDKGPYWRFWQAMFKVKGFQNDPSIWEVLGVDGPAKVRQALHSAFNVDTMSKVEPKAFEDWCEAKHLSNVIAQARGVIWEQPE